MPEIQSLYGDGACKGNPGTGGWGAVAYFTDGSVTEMGGREPATTNNRMEMQAAIEAMKFFIQSGQTTPCTLYTDSEYVIKGVTSWLKGWKSRGWKTAAGKPVLNQDLWEVLDELSSTIRLQSQGKPLRWEHVKGHAGNVGNERCDVIASSFAQGKPVSLIRSRSVSEGKSVSLPANGTNSSSPNSISTNSISINSTNSMMPNSLTSNNLTSNKTIEDHSHHSDSENLPREERVAHLHYMIDTLHIADKIAADRYFITSSELADLMDINAGAVTSRGDHWVWRNWIVSRARKEGNQILWQLERVDFPQEDSVKSE
jgi:ribonuclease HI